MEPMLQMPLERVPLGFLGLNDTVSIHVQVVVVKREVSNLRP